MEGFIQSPNDYVPKDIIKMAISIGLSASSTVILGGLYFNNNHHQYRHDRVLDWRDFAALGAIGSFIGALSCKKIY